MSVEIETNGLSIAPQAPHDPDSRYVNMAHTAGGNTLQYHTMASPTASFHLASAPRTQMALRQQSRSW